MKHVSKRDMVKITEQIKESALDGVITEVFVIGTPINTFGHLDYLIEIQVATDKRSGRCRGWLYSHQGPDEIIWHLYGWPSIVRWRGYDRHMGG